MLSGGTLFFIAHLLTLIVFTTLRIVFKLYYPSKVFLNLAPIIIRIEFLAYFFQVVSLSVLLFKQT